MNAIRIRTTLDSDTPYLPELKPLIGRTVEIIVIEEVPVPLLGPGHGNWDAVAQAVKELIVRDGYDFDALDRQNECDLRHTDDHLP